jgi:hypothetical protein
MAIYGRNMWCVIRNKKHDGILIKLDGNLQGVAFKNTRKR